MGAASGRLYDSNELHRQDARVLIVQHGCRDERLIGVKIDFWDARGCDR